MKLPLLIAVFAGLVVSGAAQAGEMELNQHFSGVTHPTMVDVNGDGVFGSVGVFKSKGSPGKSTILSFGDFTPFVPDGDICAAGEFQSDLVQETDVATFEDLSMLFSEATAGYNCFNPITFEITVELSGIFTGGTGRFEGASGSWVFKAEGLIAGPTMTAFVGTSKGTIVVPD